MSNRVIQEAVLLKLLIEKSESSKFKQVTFHRIKTMIASTKAAYNVYHAMIGAVEVLSNLFDTDTTEECEEAYRKLLMNTDKNMEEQIAKLQVEIAKTSKSRKCTKAATTVKPYNEWCDDEHANPIYDVSQLIETKYQGTKTNNIKETAAVVPEVSIPVDDGFVDNAGGDDDEKDGEKIKKGRGASKRKKGQVDKDNDKNKKVDDAAIRKKDDKDSDNKDDDKRDEDDNDDDGGDPSNNDDENGQSNKVDEDGGHHQSTSKQPSRKSTKGCKKNKTANQTDVEPKRLEPVALEFDVAAVTQSLLDASMPDVVVKSTGVGARASKRVLSAAELNELIDKKLRKQQDESLILKKENAIKFFTDENVKKYQNEHCDNPGQLVLTEPPPLYRGKVKLKDKDLFFTKTQIPTLLRNIVLHWMQKSGHVFIIVRSLVDWMDWSSEAEAQGYVTKANMEPYILSYKPGSVS
jgi:hypothetical protein